jgi:hypothetical protein
MLSPSVTGQPVGEDDQPDRIRRRGVWLPGTRRTRAARLAQLLGAAMLAGGALALLGFGIRLGPLVWAAVDVGCLAWLAIPVWAVVLGRALPRSRDRSPISQTAVSPAA